MPTSTTRDYITAPISLEFLSDCLNQQRESATSQSTPQAEVKRLIEAGQYEAATERLRNCSDETSRNLRAVVLMRMGRPAEAVALLRSLTMPGDSLGFRPGTPLHLKLNMVTALFMSGKVAGCLELLGEFSAEESDCLLNLRRNIRTWETSLRGWKRLDWRLCRIEHAVGCLPLDVLPGETDPVNLANIN